MPWRAVRRSASAGSGSGSLTSAGSGRRKSTRCTGTSRAASPTTELVLSQKHPDDYGQFAATLDEIPRTSGAFSTRHRIIDTHGEVHHVVVVGKQTLDAAGAGDRLRWFYIDLNPPITEATEQGVSKAVAEIAEAQRGRAGEGHARGRLSDRPDSAFELLKWRSQESKVKVRLRAEQVVEDFRDLTCDEALPTRAVYDRLLLTDHLRVGS